MRRKVTKKDITPESLVVPKNWSIEKDGMTQSLWKTWMSCPRKFLLALNQYESKLSIPKFSFGDLGHYILDKAYTRKKPPTDLYINKFIDDYEKENGERVKIIGKEEFEKLAAKALATTSAYFEYYADDFKNKTWLGTEQVFAVRFNGIKLRGKYDGKFKQKSNNWLFESKFYSQINEENLINQLAIDFQSNYYHLADHILCKEYSKGILYNVVRNTGKKPLKAESLPAYVKRIKAEILKTPDYFFYRFPVTITIKRAKAFQSELKKLIDDLKNRISEENLNMMNYSSCLIGVYACPFLKACSSNNLLSFDKKPGLLYSELRS